ncbi:hypothetical protein RYX56_22730, partial [Alkalihalophilus lindianensis]
MIRMITVIGLVVHRPFSHPFKNNIASYYLICSWNSRSFCNFVEINIGLTIGLGLGQLLKSGN